MDNLETIYNNNKKLLLYYQCSHPHRSILSNMYDSIFFKTKRISINRKKNFKKKIRERRPSSNVSCWKREKTIGVGGWNLQTMRRRDGFGRFPTRQRLVSQELVMFSGVPLSSAAMLSSGCQALELRERVHGGARGWCVLLCQ